MKKIFFIIFILFTHSVIAQKIYTLTRNDTVNGTGIKKIATVHWVDSLLDLKIPYVDTLTKIATKKNLTSLCYLSVSAGKSGDLNGTTALVTLFSNANTSGCSFTWYSADAVFSEDQNTLATSAGSYKVIAKKSGCVSDTAYILLVRYDEDQFFTDYGSGTGQVFRINNGTDTLETKAGARNTYTASTGCALSGNDIQFSGNTNEDIEISGPHYFYLYSQNSDQKGGLEIDNLGSSVRADMTRNGQSTYANIYARNSTTSVIPYINFSASGKLASNNITVSLDSSGMGLSSLADTAKHKETTFVSFRQMKNEMYNIESQDTARTWNGTINFNKKNIFFAQSTAVDTLKTTTTVTIAGGIPGAMALKEIVGSGNAADTLNLTTTRIVGRTSPNTNKNIDTTLGKRNIVIFNCLKNGRAWVIISKSDN